MQPGYRFRNLYGMLNEEMLKDSWRYIRKEAAYGVDRVSADDMSKTWMRIFINWWRPEAEAIPSQTRPQAVHSEREW